MTMCYASKAPTFEAVHFRKGYLAM
ncbi:hypothetical protein OIU78_012743, partial [Salix suchowensis]